MNAISTCEVKDVMQCAREEAERMGHRYIGTKHILLGILRDETGSAAIMLSGLGVSLEAVRAAIIDHVPTHKDLRGTLGSLPVSRRARQMLDLTAREAERMGTPEMDTEHLLLALLTDRNAASAKILSDMEVDYDTVQNAIAST